MALFESYRERHPGEPLLSMWVYEVGRAASFFAFRLCFAHRWLHSACVPRKGPVLLVANHQSYIDPPGIGVGVTGRHLDFIARSGLFRHEWFGKLIGLLNSIPIKEEGGDTAAMKEALRRLGMGRAVLIFPEGSRCEDGQVAPFKRGIAVLVKRARCPILPVGIDGAFDAWPRGKSPRVFTGRTAVVFGHPIDSEEVLADGADAGLERLRREVDRLRLEARAMLRRETRGAYPPPGPPDGPCAPATPAS